MPSQPADPTPSEFWTVGAGELLAALKTAPAGLTAEEAARRLLSGRNVIADTARRHILARIGKRLADPLIAILIVAAIVSAAVGDFASGAIILVILTASIALDSDLVAVLDGTRGEPRRGTAAGVFRSRLRRSLCRCVASFSSRAVES